MATVTRRDRFVDLAALLLILAGVALYLDGTRRLHEIARLTYQHPGVRGIKQVEVADRALYETYGGRIFVVLGTLVGVGSALRVVKRKPS